MLSYWNEIRQFGFKQAFHCYCHFSEWNVQVLVEFDLGGTVFQTQGKRISMHLQDKIHHTLLDIIFHYLKYTSFRA